MNNPAAFHQFLGGKLLENGTTVHGNNVRDFMTGFCYMARTFSYNKGTRASTQLRDYVLSIWVDCPDYVVPYAFKTLGLPRLLQDATDQLLAKHGIGILTTAPEGLFNAEPNGSAIWRPENYLPSVTVTALRDVYGPVFVDGTFIYTSTSGRLPLVLHSAHKVSLSTGAQDYDVSFEDIQDTADEKDARSLFIQTLTGAMGKWWDSSLSTVRSHLRDALVCLAQESRTHDDLTADEDRKKVLPLILMAKMLGDDDVLAALINLFCDNDALSFEEINWDASLMYDVLYKMMTIALRLDEGVCRDHGVRIMLAGATTLSNMNCIRLGFYRGDVDLLATEFEDASDFKSVRMSPNSGDYSGLIFEARKVGQLPAREASLRFGRARGPIPAYKVFGVWVPINEVVEGDHNAELLGKDGDDFLNGVLV